MGSLLRWISAVAVALNLLALGGCTPVSMLMGAAGVATDTSVTWEIVKHVHGKLTEGDPAPCSSLDSVERALSPRCGEYISGSLRRSDFAISPFAACSLTTAARDTRLWPVLPDLLAAGARAKTCVQSPIVTLAQANDCPDMKTVSFEVRESLMALAESDPRAVHHDVVRWLSCPNSRTAGLDAVLTTWVTAGALDRGSLSFSPLSALHPSAIGTPLSASLEARGNTVEAAFGGYMGQRASGFEEALRNSDWIALEWWLDRRPQLANRVPSAQLDWLPLARVLAPSFLTHPETRGEMVNYLLTRGADPRTRLPSEPSQSVLAWARAMRSPLLPVLEAAPTVGAPGNTVAANTSALRLMGQ